MNSKCPLEETCSKLVCDAILLVEWQSKHCSESQKVERLANRVAKFRCKR